MFITYSVRIPRPLVTVSTAVITVLHSAEVVHFHCESLYTLSPEVTSLLTHYQGMSAGFTMKPFKGSSNTLGPLSLSKVHCMSCDLWIWIFSQTFLSLLKEDLVSNMPTTKCDSSDLWNLTKFFFKADSVCTFKLWCSIATMSSSWDPMWPVEHLEQQHAGRSYPTFWDTEDQCLLTILSAPSSANMWSVWHM